MTDSEPTVYPLLEQAEAALEAGNLTEAEDLFRRHLLGHPDDAHAHNRLGVCLVRDGRLQEAATAFEEAIRLNPAHARAYTNLGNLRFEAGDLAEAEALHRQALAIDPDLGYAWGNLAAVLKRQRRIAEAVQAQKRAAKLETRLHAQAARHELREAVERRRVSGDADAHGKPWVKWIIYAAAALIGYYLLRP